MTIGFEISNDDIEQTLQSITGEEPSAERIEYIADLIDVDETEKAAMYGNDLDQQTTYALENLREQILLILSK